jgi:hypothetical protein
MAKKFVLQLRDKEIIAVVCYQCTKFWKAMSSNTTKPVMNAHFSCKEMVLWHLRLSTIAHITILQFQELLLFCLDKT